MSEVLNNQYTVFSDRYLHFGKLYWQCVAIHIAGIIMVIALFEDIFISWQGLAFIGLGLATLLMSLIIHRLRGLEKRYEVLLSNIEDALLSAGNVGIQKAPVSGRFGARFITNMILYIGSFGMIAFGIFTTNSGALW